MIDLYYVVFLSIVPCLIAFIIYLNVKYNKLLTEKDTYIVSLENKVKQVHNKLKHVNHDVNFQIFVNINNCKLKINKIGNLNISGIENREWKGIIKELSFHHVKFETNLDLPIKKHVELSIQFEEEGEWYHLKGMLTSKEELINEHAYRYYAKLINTPSVEKNKYNKLVRLKELKNSSHLVRTTSQYNK